VRQLEAGGRGRLGGARRPAALRYSKVMSWVALDRGLRLADKRSFRQIGHAWLKVRDEIYEEVMAGAGTRAARRLCRLRFRLLDASSLLMPLVFFLARTPRMLSTLDGSGGPSPRAPGRGRFGLPLNPAAAPDGLPAARDLQHVLLLACRGADPRRPHRSRPDWKTPAALEQMLGYEPPRLYAEQTGASARPGQLPAGVHDLALISAAFNLERTLDPGESSDDLLQGVWKSSKPTATSSRPLTRPEP